VTREGGAVATAQDSPGAPSASPALAPGPAAGTPLRRRGRPRSEHAERAIIDATLEIFAETGVAGLCIEQVAARAGVGKATIYRRWPGKEDLLLDAMARLRTPLPTPAGKSVRDDLVLLLDSMRTHWSDPGRARLLGLMLGEGIRYPRLMDRYVATVLEPRREMARSVLRRGVATGELREDADIEAALFMLTGAILARARLGQQRVERSFGRRVVDELLAGIAAR
jgi:AcrR family transcriptional regulator